MNYTEKSQIDRVATVERAMISVLGHEELKLLVAQRGYPVERVEQGLDLARTAKACYAVQVKEYGEAYAATEICDEQSTKHREDIKDFRQISRVVCKNDTDSQQRLLLNERLKRSFPQYCIQVETSIKNALESTVIKDALLPYGYGEEQLQQFLEELNELPELKRIQKNEQTDAQEATAKWHDALDAMDEFYVDFMQIAPVAVKSRPELLELLGVVVES